mgnify:CR=1 FL=1
MLVSASAIGYYGSRGNNILTEDATPGSDFLAKVAVCWEAEALAAEAFGVRVVVGKGGMGKKTLAALKEHGAVYVNGIGGAAQYYARTMEKVLGVSLLDFGIPEAMWNLRIRDFAGIVTMDAHGNSLHAGIEAETGTHLEELQTTS